MMVLIERLADRQRIQRRVRQGSVDDAARNWLRLAAMEAQLGDPLLQSWHIFHEGVGMLRADLRHAVDLGGNFGMSDSPGRGARHDGLDLGPVPGEISLASK